MAESSVKSPSFKTDASADTTAPAVSAGSSLPSQSGPNPGRRRSASSSSSSSSSASARTTGTSHAAAATTATTTTTQTGFDAGGSEHDRSQPSPLAASSSSAKPASTVPSGGSERDHPTYQPRLGRIREDRDREADIDRASRSRQEAAARVSSKESSHSSKSDGKPTSRRRVVTSEDVGIGSGRVYRRNARHRSTREPLVQRQLNSLANASLISVLSSLTAVTSTSSGSNSTITQATYDRKQGHRKKRTRSRYVDEEQPAFHEPRYKEDPKAYSSRHRSFMDESADGRAGSSGRTKFSRSPSVPETRLTQSLHTYYSAKDRTSPVQRMDRSHSDSGISMDADAASLDKTSPIVRHDSVIESNKLSARRLGSDSDPDYSDEGEEDAETGTEGLILPPEVSQYLDTSDDGLAHDRRLREELHERESEIQQHILQSPQPRRFTSFTRPKFDVQPGLPAYPPHVNDLRAAAPAPPIQNFHDGLHTLPPYQSRRSSVSTSWPTPPSYTHQVQGRLPPRRVPLAIEQTAESSANTARMGYDLLASKLAEYHDAADGVSSDQSTASNGSAGQAGLKGDSPFAPAYRRFDKLSHRLLLHVQDELAEMEEELQRIDCAIAQHHSQQHWYGGNGNGNDNMNEPSSPSQPQTQAKVLPSASRRMDARVGSELSDRRTRFLGHIYNKLEQYNKMLAWWAETGKTFVAADEGHVRRYAAWMEENRPVVEAERAFLAAEKRGDLIVLKRSDARLGLEACSRCRDEAATYRTLDRAGRSSGAAQPYGNLFGMVCLMNVCLALLLFFSLAPLATYSFFSRSGVALSVGAAGVLGCAALAVQRRR